VEKQTLGEGSVAKKVSTQRGKKRERPVRPDLLILKGNLIRNQEIQRITPGKQGEKLGKLKTHQNPRGRDGGKNLGYLRKKEVLKKEKDRDSRTGKAQGHQCKGVSLHSRSEGTLYVLGPRGCEIGWKRG